MKIVQEMYARGYEFMPIDIFQAKAKHFQIIDGKLMPALNTIDGMGDKAAEGVVEAAKDGPFTSCENFKTAVKSAERLWIRCGRWECSATSRSATRCHCRFM